MSDAPTLTRDRPRPRWKKVLFWLILLMAGAAPFLLAEAGLRILGSGKIRPNRFNGFGQTMPLFERRGDIYRTSPARLPFFCMQEFAAEKPPGVRRIFCFGGSTVHGHPYQSDTAFAKWLELELNVGGSAHSFEVMNCGGVSYASYRLAPLVREVLRYSPDLIIVATGENEFLEDRTFSSIKEHSASRRWVENKLGSLRIVALAERIFEPGAASPGCTPEVNPRLDTQSGYASYHRDAAWHTRISRQFKSSLRDMAASCARARVPLIFIKLGSNLRDCPPFKSEHRAGLPFESELKWQQAFERGAEAEQSAPAQALQHYKTAETIDPEYALLDWRIARALERVGRKMEALQYYIRARDYDVCPLRLLSENELVLEQVAAEASVPVFDAGKLLAGRSQDGIPGSDQYLDHVHPTIGGHQAIAAALAANLRELGLAPKTELGNPSARAEIYRAHLSALGTQYFADARRRVEWLEHWSRRERFQDEARPIDTDGCVRLASRSIQLRDLGAVTNSLLEACSLAPGARLPLERLVLGLQQEGMVEVAAELEAVGSAIMSNSPAKPVLISRPSLQR